MVFLKRVKEVQLVMKPILVFIYLGNFPLHLFMY
jgi:hypothetical protein